MQTKTAVALPRDIDADLDGWLEPFLDATGRKTRRKMAPLYVRGLLGGGERKSIQPMAERLGMPGHDQLHHFISSPAWDDAPLWRVLAEQAGFSRTLCGRFRSCGDEDALPEQVKASTAVHGALDRLQPIDLPLGGTGAPGRGNGRDHGRLVALEAPNETV